MTNPPINAGVRVGDVHLKVAEAEIEMQPQVADSSRLRSLARRLGMDRQRVHAAFKLFRQCRIDHAVPLQPALSAEGRRHNIESEMGFPAGPVSGMAFMQMRFILDMHALRRKGREQLGGDDILHSHGAQP